MIVIGLSSGTSRDGIDVAAVDFRLSTESEEPGLLASLLYAATESYPAKVAADLDRLIGSASTLAHLLQTDRGVGRAFAAAAGRAVEAVPAAELVCSHGQTAWHLVEEGVARASLQLGNPAWIAEATGLPVVSDVRMRDIAAGGQGAPLVPLLDALVLGGLAGRPAALNLGGIANITLLDGERTIAFDVGPANSLIDAAVRSATDGGLGYDVDGRLAAFGHVDEDLLAELLAHPYFSAPLPKSTGPEVFGAAMVAELQRRRPEQTLHDLVATLTELTARTVADQLRTLRADAVFVSGGGARNPVLLERLRLAAGIPITTSDALGLPIDAKEAIAFALIGWHTAHGLPGNEPDATGARGPRILGTITPGRGLPRRESVPRPRWIRMCA